MKNGKSLIAVEMQYKFKKIKVPRVGIEPTLSKELDFESSASTSSATEAYVERIFKNSKIFF